MKSRQIRNSMLLVLTALIWGTAFVAQRQGGDAVGPFTFNGIRSFIGSAVLLPVIFGIDRIHPSEKRPRTAEDKRKLWLGGICCGGVLFLASSAQQLGLYMGTPAGKAGFLTACYILLVPILGLFLKKKCGWNIWVGIGLTVVGLYLLCMTESLSFQASDLMVLLCALLFAIHILVIDYFSPKADGVVISCVQFFTAGVLACVLMLLFEHPSMSAVIAAAAPILYAGVMSCGVGYTLQVVAQNGVDPTIASLLLSLESVFSVLAGWVILGQKLSGRELFGCALVFAAVLLVQIPTEKLFPCRK